MAYSRYATEMKDGDNNIYGLMDEEARAQLSDLNSALNNSTDTEVVYFTNGYYITTKNSTADISQPQARSDMSYAVVDCQQGDQFTVTATGSSNGRAYAFIDSSGNVIDSPKAGLATAIANLVVTVPATAVKAIFNARVDRDRYICKNISIPMRINNLTLANEDEDYLLDGILNLRPYNLLQDTTPHSYLDSSGQYVTNSQSNYGTTPFFEVNRNCIIVCKQTDTTEHNFIHFYNENKEAGWIERHDVYGAAYFEYDLSKINSVKYVRFSYYYNTNNLKAYYYTPFDIFTDRATIAENNALGKTTTKTLHELIPATEMGVFYGKLTSKGTTTGADNYYASRSKFQAKAGSFLQLKSGSDAISFSVALFNSSGDLISIVQDYTDKYTIQQDGYLRVDVQVASEESRDREKIWLIDACIIQDYEPRKEAYVSNEAEFIQALSSCQVIHLLDDIIFGGEPVKNPGDLTVYGHGHKFYRTYTEVTYNFMQIFTGNVEFHNLLVDGGGTVSSPIKPLGTSIIKFYDCEFYNCDGDGIGPAEGSTVYCYNCKLHDNTDEGFSSHGGCYCELYDCEVYHNGYIPYSDTPSGENSYGGIHLGGSHVGVVKGCYAHHNYGGGINLCPLGQAPEDRNMRAYAIDNIITDNTRNGIRLEGLFNCRIIGNTIINNGPSGWAGIRVWIAQNTGVEPTTSGIIAKNVQALNGSTASGNQVSIDADADGGIVVE